MTTEFVIPSSEADRKLIRDCMQELSNSYLRTEAEKDFVKEALADLEEKVGIPKKVLKKVSVILHKQNLSEIVTEMEDLEALAETLK